MESDTVVVRGFSNTFAFDKKVEVMDLQFIEGEELERQWKVARRQRLKEQEDKIWNEFVKEEDVVLSISREDPYQFLNQLPEAHVKDLFESELSRIKKELEGQKRGAGDSPRNDKSSVLGDAEPDEMFHIFDDEKEDAAEENLNDTLESPCTVRERDEDKPSARERGATVARTSGASVPPSTPPTENMQAEVSTENVATVIESSIYCARVKELRIKIIAEIHNMIQSLENQNIASIDSLQLRQLCRRAAEYSARYQRIHLYQLQRQVNDIKRHNAMALPFARHTQFQSQMVRIVALHQNTLQSLQVFHKSFEQTSCLRECSTQLRMICATLRDSTAACREVAVPNDFSAAKELYNDTMLAACDGLEDALQLYVNRVDEYIAAADQVLTNRSSKPSMKSKSKPSPKKKPNNNTWSQKATKNSSLTEANARLSMYSLETLQLNKKSKLTKSEKGRADSNRRKGKVDKNTPKSHRKSPRNRRPLMRDPHSGDRRRVHGRDTRPDNDPDVPTLVEAIGMGAASSHMSGDTSPNSLARSPRKSYLLPPRSPRPARSPRPHVPPIALKQSSASPRVILKKRPNPYLRSTPTNPRNETTCTSQTNQPVSPTSKVQTSKKDYRKNEDSEVQTIASDSKAGNLSTRTEGSARSDFDRDGSEWETKESLRSSLDSSRSDMSRVSRGWRGKGPHSARSEHREAEGQEVTRLLKQLCAAGDTVGNKTERMGSAKNAQLVCVNASSPRQPTTPQLLRILEETIQKKIPSNLYMKPKTRDAEKMRLAFNIPQRIADNLFQYRTKFVQHMLTSSMYANSAVGKPWEMISSVSEGIIDEVLAKCATEMQIESILLELYQCETQ